MGASSATEYPALETPTHMLIPAATSQSGTKTLTAFTSPTAAVGPPTQRPMRRHTACRTRPPAMTLTVCIIVHHRVSPGPRFWPPCNASTRARSYLRGVWIQPELEPANVEADIERLIEVGFHAERGSIPCLGSLQI